MFFTDDFQVNTGITFDNKFIMNMSDDEAVMESLHGIAEWVMRSKFNMFPIVEGKEARTNNIDKVAIICGSILTFGMHLFYKENGARIALLPGKSANPHPSSVLYNSRVRRCGVSELPQGSLSERASESIGNPSVLRFLPGNIKINKLVR